MPVFYHLLMVGWITQLICGVALSMFPPLSHERPRGDERLGWLCYGLLYAIAGLAIVRHAWPRIVPFRALPRAGTRTR